MRLHAKNPGSRRTGPHRITAFARAALTGLVAAGSLALASEASAQLTHQQRGVDFQSLVGLYDKQYGPYEWKRQAFRYDLLDTDKWLEQARESRDDLAFYDLSVRYVASLNDAHDEFTLTSLYEAWLPITADLYDGKVLIDAIDRTVLSVPAFPFAVGDELVAVDGRPMGEWIKALRPYSANGRANPVSRDRLAVATTLDRLQAFYPYAVGTKPGDTATVRIRSAADGRVADYVLPWKTAGVPLTTVGPVPNPGDGEHGDRDDHDRGRDRHERALAERVKLAGANPWGLWTGERQERERAATGSSEGKRERLQEFSALEPDAPVGGGLFPFSSFFPKFNPPAGFLLRRGGRSTDEFVTGTFPAGGKTFGFIRIPSFAPASRTNALSQFQSEIAFMQQNTAGVVIDLMGNGGGNLCYANNLIQFLAPGGFAPIPLKIRANEFWIANFDNALETAEARGVPQATLDVLAGFLTEVRRANAESRGLTVPIPFISPAGCSLSGGSSYPPATDSHGVNLAFTKPIVLLTDNFSISSAEFFAATLQDLGRVSVYGTRTSGAGGNVVGYNYLSGPYAMGSTRVTQSIGVRTRSVSVPGLPSAPYIENLGVQPDLAADYQTTQNLLTNGAPFVSGFVALVQGLAGP